MILLGLIISPNAGFKLVNGDLGSDPVATVTLALAGCHFSLKYRHVILPILTTKMIFPLLVSLIDRTTKLYYLAGSDLGWEASCRVLEVSQY